MTPSLTITWHGIKTIPKPANGLRLVPEADLYVDCRGIKEHGLGEGGGGLNPKFQAAIERSCSAPSIDAMVTLITNSLLTRKDRSQSNDPYVVCFLCSWGKDRSPATGSIVGKRLRALGYTVQIPLA